MAGCLGDETIAGYVDGSLDLAAMRQVDHHLDTCTSCRSQLSAVAALPLVRSFISGVEETAPAADVDALIGRAPGEVLDGMPIGRYRAEAVIGRGAMGIVLRARDPELDRAIAIKLVDAAAAPGEWRAHLRGEARAMARLRHPNVVTVYDAGAIGHVVFVAMELVDGESFAARLARDRSRVLELCIAAGRGLCAAHAADIVHGDVKPDNILVDRDGRALVGDFGLSRGIVEGAADGARTLAGTPAYMAPELLRREPATPATDQFAFAVTVYEAFTGRRPWRAASLEALRDAIEREPPARPPEIPRKVWRAIERGLAADPARRYPSLAELVAALERAARRPRWPYLTAGGALVVSALAVGKLTYRPDTCVDPIEPVRALTGASLCGASASEPCRLLVANLDAQASAWRKTHIGVCEATRDGQQSAELLDRRMRCLDDRLRERTALVERLHAPLGNADAFDATTALQRFSPTESCATIDRATSALPAPLTPAITEAEHAIASAQAEYALGHYQAGLDALTAQAPTITALGQPALAVAALRTLGELQIERGDLAGAEASFGVALHAAAEAGDDEATAGIYLSLAHLQGAMRQQWSRTAELLRAADAAVARAGHPPLLEARLVTQRGFMAQATGDAAGARDDFTHAVELRRTFAPPTDVAMSLQHLCEIDDLIGKLPEGRAHCQEAFDIQKRALGAGHPLAAEAEVNLGVALATAGDFTGARDHWQAALATLERGLGDDAPSLSTVLVDLVDVERQLGDGPAAERYLARASKVVAHAPSTADGLDIQELVANSLREAGKLDEAQHMLEPLAQRATVSLGLEHPSTVRILIDLGTAYYLAGKFKEARDAYGKASDGAKRLYGDQSPSSVGADLKLGETMLQLHQDGDACPLFERATVVLEATGQASSGKLAEAYTNLAICAPGPRAVEAARKGLALREQRHDSPARIAEARFELGRAMWRADKDPKAADVVRQARSELSAADPHSSGLAEIDAWLAGKR